MNSKRSVLWLALSLSFLGMTNGLLSQTQFWEQKKFHLGGFVWALAVDSKGDLFAGNPEGLFRSAGDSNNAWVPTSLTFTAIGSLAIASDGAMFAASGKTVYRSTDNGDTWAQTNLRLYYLRTLAINDSGHLFAGSYGEWLYRSTDSGETWTMLRNGLSDPYVDCVSINATGDIFVAIRGGIFRSLDNGDNWTPILRHVDARSLAIGPNGHLFAGADIGRVYRSMDNGDTWAIIDAISADATEALLVSSNGNVYAGTNRGLFRSTKNGENFIRVMPSSHNFSVYSLASASSGKIFVGTIGGVYCLQDDGDAWSLVPANVSEPHVYALGIEPSGQIFTGTGGGVFRSLDNGDTWKVFNVGLAYYHISSLVMNSNGDIWAGTENGIFCSTITGESWTPVDFPNNQVRTLVIDSDETIYAGTFGSGIFRSQDNGCSWEEINFGLVMQYVLSLAVNSKGDVFAGTVDGVYRSTDKGANWSRKSVDQIYGPVRTLAIDLDDEIFLGSSARGPMRSTDNGETWVSISKGLSNRDVFAFAITSRNELFAGTAGGIFRSHDNGDSWVPINDGIRYPYIRSFAINPQGYIFTGTEGNGVYRSIQPVTIVEKKSNETPSYFALHQNHPNPFNSSTTINFSLPRASLVTLKIYNLLGEEVATLVNEHREAGEHRVQWQAHDLPSGVYVYRLQAGEHVESKKLVLLR